MNNPQLGGCRFWRSLTVFFACVCCTLTTAGQVISYSIERQKRLTQTSTNPIPFLYQFNTKVYGTGLQHAEVYSPLSTNSLEGNSLQMSFGTNYPAISLEG